MSARGVLLVVTAMLSGCALVSGLSNLEVLDASAPIEGGSSDVVTIDALSEAPPIPAGDAGYALKAAGGCAYGATLSLSNTQFSLSLWLRVDALPSSDNDILPIIWNGGRGASEQGWSLDLTAGGVEFCVADQNGGVCTTKYGIKIGALVHIVATSPYSGVTSGRSLNIYADDISTSGGHTLVASASGAEGNWSTSAPFTIGGAMIGPACTSAAHVTVDRVAVYSVVIPQAQMDALETQSVCTSSGVLADYEFDEGVGPQAKNCASNAALTLGPSTGFVVSPFK